MLGISGGVKLAGSILIVAASLGLAYSIKRELTEHLRLLYEARRILVSLSCEAACSMQPVEILLSRFSGTKEEKLGEILKNIRVRLLAKEYGQGEEIWREEFESGRKKLGFTEEEIEILKGAGTAFFGKSVDENKRQLSLTLERLDFVIEHTRGDLKSRQKVYQTVSIMCGFLLIILLI